VEPRVERAVRAASQNTKTQKKFIPRGINLC
jgi:hypothetical protein